MQQSHALLDDANALEALDPTIKARIAAGLSVALAAKKHFCSMEGPNNASRRVILTCEEPSQEEVQGQDWNEEEDDYA